MKQTSASILIISIALALFAFAPWARAADQVVTDFGDNGGPNQLRAKLADLESSGGGTLTFVGGPATITVAGGLLSTITVNSVIDGGDKITLHGSSGARFFIVNSGAALTLKNIVLERGYFNGEGGAILNGGTLTLNHTTIQNCYAPLGGGGIATTSAVDIADSTFANNISGNGAAIYAHTPTAVVTIIGSSFHDNSVSSTDSNQARGGAIYLVDGAAATIRGSDFYNNKAFNGGAIASFSATSALSLRDSKVRLNTATSLGGGIDIDGGAADLTNVTLSGNTGQLSGAIFNSNGTVTITNSTFSENKETAGGYGGAGISNYNSAAKLTLTGVTFSGNTAGGGGAGIENAFGASVTLTNVTLSGNIAGNMGGQGGGIHNYKATATLTNVTFSGNSAPTSSTSGGGIWNENDPNTHLFLKNVIIANSVAGGNAGFAKAPDTNDSNLSSDNTCNFGAGHDNVDVKLGPLASNGGFTQTHSLLAGSPAINAANPALAPAKDQRGYARVDAPDIGSFEFGSTIPATLGNISTRLRVETGENVLIGGFIITGTHAKQVLLRAIGPSTGLAGALANPTLELHDGNGQLIASNDNWASAANHVAIFNTGIAPTNALESAILKTLDPGSYTAIVRGVNNTTGVGLVEAYDLDRTTDSVLGNISTRGLVQTGDNAMIGGFIVVGTDPQKVIVRGIGPSLPLTGKLADPILELHDGNGVLLVTNDNWRTTQEAEIIATGIPPANDLESAIVRTLNPGSYTAIMRGVNGASGVGLIEVYNLN